jgi:hypothetical protein
LTCLALPAAASADTDYSACWTAEGNRLAGPHPFLDGQLLDEDGPGYTPFQADVYMNEDETWLGARVGDVGHRVVLPAASPVTPPTESVWDAFYDALAAPHWSSCQAEGTLIAHTKGGDPQLGTYSIDVYSDGSNAEVCYSLESPNVRLGPSGIGIDLTP